MKPSNSFVNNIIVSKPRTLFGDVKVVNRDSVIELKANYGVSKLRDIVTTTNSATVTNDFTEYNLNTGTSPNSLASLESAERGRYIPGAEAEAGIGVRIDEVFTGDEYAEWGYFDDNDGFGFGSDSTGHYIFIRSGGLDIKEYQADWNGDKMNGTASQYNLDLSDGNIFQINYCWYGYGAIEFRIVITDNNGIQQLVTVHRFSPQGVTSVKDPNLPITAIISNGSGTSDLNMYIGGRQYAVFTPFNPNKRISSHTVLNKTGIGETFVPIMTFRRKTNYKSVASKVSGLDLITDTSLIYQFRLNSTLTNDTYGDPAYTSAEETAMEVDDSADTITGGELLYPGLAATSGTGGNASGQIKINNLGVDIPTTATVTLCVRTLSGSGATVSAIARLTEEW